MEVDIKFNVIVIIILKAACSYGGYGVTTAPGTAIYAVKLIEELMESDKVITKAKL